MSDTQILRVIDSDGTAHEVRVRREWDEWVAGTLSSDVRCRASTVRFAVTRYAARVGWEVAEILTPDNQSRAELTRERDAAIAALDAVRADHAPRREPPTADEVRALAGLRGDGFDPQWIVRFDADTLVAMTVSVGLGSAGAIVCHDFAGTRRDPVEFATWAARGPDGPVSWSELAALVAEVRRG